MAGASYPKGTLLEVIDCARLFKAASGWVGCVRLIDICAARLGGNNAASISLGNALTPSGAGACSSTGCFLLTVAVSMSSVAEVIGRPVSEVFVSANWAPSAS